MKTTKPRRENHCSRVGAADERWHVTFPKEIIHGTPYLVQTVYWSAQQKTSPIQEEHRFLADADALYDRLMIRGYREKVLINDTVHDVSFWPLSIATPVSGQKEMARLGCPDWKKWVPAVSRVLPWIASAVHCVGLELERPATLMRAFAQYSVVRQCDRGMF